MLKRDFSGVSDTDGMPRATPTADFRTSLIGEGLCFVYVLPCVWEDLLKLGFSRDPLARAQSLHPRWFEFFDLDRAILIETETVRDARRIELELGHAIAAHGATEPLTIRSAAGGGTEWYRGALGFLEDAAASLGVRGHVVHAPARDWLRERLRARGDLLFAWSHEALAAIAQARHFGDDARAIERTLQSALDAYQALAIDPDPLLSEPVRAWYRSHGAELP